MSPVPDEFFGSYRVYDRFDLLSIDIQGPRHNRYGLARYGDVVRTQDHLLRGERGLISQSWPELSIPDGLGGILPPRILNDTVGVAYITPASRSFRVSLLNGGCVQLFFFDDHKHMPCTKAAYAELLALPAVGTASNSSITLESVAVLPAWVQDRLRILSILHVPPPEDGVEGIGMRMGHDIYWVEFPQEGAC